MTRSNGKILSRRGLLRAGAALAGATLAAPSIAQQAEVFAPEPENDPAVSRNISSFRARSWQPHFSNTRNGAILVDTTSRALHYWSADQSIYKLYPTSVPLSEDLTRRGRTSVIRKVVGPSWSPTWMEKK